MKWLREFAERHGLPAQIGARCVVVAGVPFERFGSTLYWQGHRVTKRGALQVIEGRVWPDRSLP